MADIQTDLLAKQKIFATDKVKGDVSSFFDGIVTQFKKEHNKLPERFFTTMFLPYFSGQKKIEPNSTVLADWFSVAGSHTAEVTIIDNTTNQPLFDVPAVSARSRINSTYNTNRQMMSLEDVAVMAISLGQTVAQRGNKFAADAYGQRLKVLLDKNNPIAKEALSDLDKDLIRWNEIFERYGIVSKDTTQPAASTENGRVEDDDMYFE